MPDGTGKGYMPALAVMERKALAVFLAQNLLKRMHRFRVQGLGFRVEG